MKHLIALALCSVALTASAWNRPAPVRNAATVQPVHSCPSVQRFDASRLETVEACPITGEAHAGMRLATETATILSEDFSLMTLGEEGNPDLTTNIINSDGYIYYDYVNTYGWAGVNVYSAGGNLYIGENGLVNTPFLDLTGIDGSFNVYVRFRMATTSSSLAIVALKQGASELESIDGIRVGGSPTQWGYYNFNVKSGGTNKTTIQFGGYTDAVYIDEIIVTQEVEVEEPTSIDAPGNLSASDITATSFTATWSEVTAATGYWLDVYYYATDNEKVYHLQDQPVSGTTYSVTGLDSSHTYYFSVQAYNDQFTSEESAQVIAKEASTSVGIPTALEATEVTDDGFRANWSQAANASWYTLYTYSYHTITEDGWYEIENETFDKSTQGTMAEPLYNDIDAMLNDYTQYPDWEGITTLRANGMIALRNYYQVMGYYSALYSPIYWIDADGPIGRVTVTITAARDSNCSSATQLGVCLVNPENGAQTDWEMATMTNSVGVYTFTLNAFDIFYAAISFGDENNSDYGLTGTVWIDEVKISQDLNAGDVLSRLYAYDVVYGGTSFYVPTPNRGDDYFSYMLTAGTNGSEGNITSDGSSNEIYVHHQQSGMCQTMTTAADAMAVKGQRGQAIVTLAQAATIEAYNMAGAKVATLNGRTGDNAITLPQGIYVIRAQGKAAKVAVK